MNSYSSKKTTNWCINIGQTAFFGMSILLWLLVVDKLYQKGQRKKQGKSTKNMKNKKKSKKVSKGGLFTHFWALKISDESLKQEMMAIQENMFGESSKDDKKFVIKPEKFHITIGLMSLHSLPNLMQLQSMHNRINELNETNSQTLTHYLLSHLNYLLGFGSKQESETQLISLQKKEYQTEYAKSESEFCNFLKNKEIEIDTNNMNNSQLSIVFDKIDGFGNKNKSNLRVIYLGLSDNSIKLLTSVRNNIAIIVDKYGLSLEKDKNYTPHMTLAKINYLLKKHKKGEPKRLKFFDKTTTNQMKNMQNDCQLLQNLAKHGQQLGVLQLCSLQGQKNGYYRVVCEVPIRSTKWKEETAERKVDFVDGDVSTFKSVNR